MIILHNIMHMSSHFEVFSLLDDLLQKKALCLERLALFKARKR